VARIALAAIADMDPRQRAQYDRFPSNLTRTLVLLDERLARALPETANALRAASFDAKWREGVILRVAAVTGSAYERVQHLDQALRQGWSSREIAAIEAGDRARLPAEFVAVLDFVDACLTGYTVDDEIFATVQAVLTTTEIVTVLVLVGHYRTVATLTGVLQVEVDPAPDPWTHEH
jgi:alkylhydroperoxidase family enzyme